MNTSEAIKIALSRKGLNQGDLANFMGKSKQCMSRKINCGAWYVRDITNEITKLTGAKLILKLEDGEELELTDEGGAKYSESEKRYIAKKKQYTKAEDKLISEYGEDYLDKLLDEEDELI